MKKLLTLFAALVVVTTVSAKDWTNEELGAKGSIPDNWGYWTEGDYTQMGGVDGMRIYVRPFEPEEESSGDFPDLTATWNQFFDEMIYDHEIKITKEGQLEKVTHNGMAALFSLDQGKYEGKRIKMITMALRNPKVSRGNMVIFAYYPANDSKAEKLVTKAIKSIKPL